ncbi:MAG: hypothetical protein ACK5LP_07685 [Campylobacteraceae bacterium]
MDKKTLISFMGIGISIVLFVTLLLGFFHRGYKIEALELRLDNYIIKANIDKTNIEELKKSINTQNKEIEKFAIDMKNANTTIKEQRKVIAQKYKDVTNLNNVTCEMTLNELKKIEEIFYGTH